LLAQSRGVSRLIERGALASGETIENGAGHTRDEMLRVRSRVLAQVGELQARLGKERFALSASRSVKDLCSKKRPVSFRHHPRQQVQAKRGHSA
jgi:hypothetical protein